MSRLRKAFTLVELLLVIGIMGVLATVSVGGYTALTRGMAERGALDAAAGVFEAALQRAQIDRTRTYVFLYDEVLRAETDDEVGIACGVLIAVRPIGRVTHVGSYICDEFGDLNQGFSGLSGDEDEEDEKFNENLTGMMRLYNLTQPGFAQVREGVFYESNDDQDLEEGKQREMGRHGFKPISGASFSPGDLYGQEFMVMRLPAGFIFGSSITMGKNDLGMKPVGQHSIEPDATSAPSVPVYRITPGGQPVSIGNTSQAKDINRK